MTRLKQILEAEGRKQSWLCRQTGIDDATLSRYVNGLHCPDDKQVLIARALGRKVEDLFPSEEVPA